MRHDGMCERSSPVASIYGLGCRCGSRAYAANPLPNDWTPIWAKQERSQRAYMYAATVNTPSQEGG